MPEIRLQNMVKRYGSVEVLHGIDLAMAENEFTVLVGPSGLREIHDAAHDRGARDGHGQARSSSATEAGQPP